MGTTLEAVRSSQVDVLGPGEDYLAAARVDRKSGFLGGIPVVEVVNLATREHPPATNLPKRMVWAATNHRLLVWTVDPIRGTKPRTLIGSFPYGAEVHWIRAFPKSETRGAPAGKTYLTVGLRGVAFEAELKVAAAHELAAVVDRHLPPMPPGWGAPPGLSC